MSEWRDISTAPRDGTPVLAVIPNYPRAVLARFIDHEIREYGIRGERLCYWRVMEADWVERHWSNWPIPTHWTPLPEPPR